MFTKLGGIAPECIRLESVFFLDRENPIIRLVLLALVTLSTLRVSADFTITKCDEASIREALENGPIIKFSCDGTITLTNNLTISDEMVFDASGHAVTISGGQKARVFQVNTGVNLTLINLTVANGYSTNGGGGIYNDGGKLSLINCTLSGNRAVGSSKDWVTASL